MKYQHQNGSNNKEVKNVIYYDNFQFKSTNLEENDIYIALVENEKDGSTIYSIYSGNSNKLIATVDVNGKIHFLPEYIEEMRDKFGELFDELNLDNAEFGLPEELKEKDIVLTENEIIEENERKRNEKLGEISKIVGVENIDSYSEIDTNQKIDTKNENEKDKDNEKTFEKITSKQEIDANVRVTQTESLADMIPEIKEKGFVKVGVVYSNGSKGQNGRFSFVGIT